MKYREGEFDSLANNRDIGRVAALGRFEKHLFKVGDSDYRLRRPGENPGPLLGLAELMKRTRNLTKNAAENNHVGYKLSAKSDTIGATAYGILLTDPEPDILDTPGNPYVDLVWTRVLTRYPKVTSLGNCYCRRIDGSINWSQHAFCNAQDFGAPSGAQFWPMLVGIYTYLVANADEFNTQTAIVQDRIWTRGEGERYYGGQYHYHVHTDGFPNGVGTPPCAQ